MTWWTDFKYSYVHAMRALSTVIDPDFWGLIAAVLTVIGLAVGGVLMVCMVVP